MMNNPYLNHDGVLTNKLGITDKETLKQVEYEITTHKQREILENDALSNIKGFGFERQQAIHKYLFEDIYEWAGKSRTVPYSKQMDNGYTCVFANPNVIQARWSRNILPNSRGLRRISCFGENVQGLVGISSPTLGD